MEFQEIGEDRILLNGKKYRREWDWGVRYKALNKNIALEWRTQDGVDFGSPRIIANPYELAKNAVKLFAQKSDFYHTSLPLPHFALSFDDSQPDLQSWYNALISDNHPKKVCFGCRGNPDKYARFCELIDPLDFSKPFDKGIVDKIRSEFAVSRHKTPAVEIDAVAIEMGDEEAP